MSLVLVDLDGTLLPGASSERRFIARLLARRRLGPTQIVCALWFLLRHWPANGRQTFKKNKAYLAGLPVAEVAALAETFVRADIEPRLRGTLLRRLERHRRAGDVVALLSGAPDFIVAPLAERLEIAVWRATRCAQRDGRFLAEPPFRHPFAEQKLRFAREICAALGVGLLHRLCRFGPRPAAAASCRPAGRGPSRPPPGARRPPAGLGDAGRPGPPDGAGALGGPAANAVVTAAGSEYPGLPQGKTFDSPTDCRSGMCAR